MFEKEAEDNKPPYAYCSLNTNCELWKDGFQKGAEFGYNKAKEEMQKNGLALQSDMDKTIEQNIQLKKEIEKMTKEELKEQDIRLNRLCFDYQEKEKRIAELEKELEQAKKVQVVEHFEAYGQCRDSRRIASLETKNAELKDKLKNLESVAEVRLANWQKYEKENAELKTQAKKIILKLYNVGRDVLMCRADEAAYDNLSTAINDRSIEQFLKENNNEQSRT